MRGKKDFHQSMPVILPFRTFTFVISRLKRQRKTILRGRVCLSEGMCVYFHQKTCRRLRWNFPEHTPYVYIFKTDIPSPQITAAFPFINIPTKNAKDSEGSNLQTNLKWENKGVTMTSLISICRANLSCVNKGKKALCLYCPFYMILNVNYLSNSGFSYNSNL